MNPLNEEYRPPRIGRTQIRLLEKLTNASGVSGNENEVRSIVLEQIRPHVTNVEIDALGNVLAVCKGKTAMVFFVLIPLVGWTRVNWLANRSWLAKINFPE